MPLPRGLTTAAVAEAVAALDLAARQAAALDRQAAALLHKDVAAGAEPAAAPGVPAGKPVGAHAAAKSAGAAAAKAAAAGAVAAGGGAAASPAPAKPADAAKLATGTAAAAKPAAAAVAGAAATAAAKPAAATTEPGTAGTVDAAAGAAGVVCAAAAATAAAGAAARSALAGGSCARNDSGTATAAIAAAARGESDAAAAALAGAAATAQAAAAAVGRLPAAAGATLRRIIGKAHVVQSDGAGRCDKEPAAEPGPAAAAGAAGAALRDCILDRQVFERDIAGIDEEASMGVAAVDRLYPGAADAGGPGDRQRRPASLMARLDRLGPAKEIAQIGAAIGREFPYDLLRAVARIDDIALHDALDRLEVAELASSRGKPPKAVYTFKHSPVQDAAHGTLLREPRRALHARIAEVIESQFADIAENQPELLARHCAEAGLTEKAIGLWGQAAERSEARSALVEAAEHFKHALKQIATLPATPARRCDEIKLQVALITPLIHVRGYSAPETKAAAERARLLIEQAEGMGEPQEDPLLLFSVLYGFWIADFVAFNGDAIRELAAQFLALAKKQGTTGPRMNGHRMMGNSLMLTGDIVEGRTHCDQAIALYDPVEHRPLATRFGQDMRVAALSFRSLALWLLGYPEAALSDATQAVKDAREIGQASTLMYALNCTTMFVYIPCGNYTAAQAVLEEVITLADEKGALWWKAFGTMNQARVLALSGKASDAIHTFVSGIAASLSTRATLFMPLHLSHLGREYAEVGQFDDAWRCIGEALTAVETNRERWFEAEVHRISGEIALLSPDPDTAKAQAYFERALAVARQQHAKSWELRAAMSMARLWRDQGERNEARNLLAPVYNWFTEGFNTRDLKEAKALLDTLAS